MPTASYIKDNDYSLVDRLRPFNLPTESTMQEIATKTQYWKIGADRMKSVYDQAVGLDPQFMQNKEYLKGFMSDAETKLQKISKSDLAVLDNSQEAVNVFKPLYDTKNPFNYRLLMDSQLNKHYKEQEQISETYRTKDGGKEWNQNNDFYFRDAQQKYLEDARAGKLDSIDSHFQNRKSYIPFYDGKKEILDIQDACKGYSFDKKGIAPNSELYFNEQSKSGCSPTELAMAFKTGLSDRFKQQAMIDGYAHFKGNEDQLAKQFTDIYITRSQDQINNIEATVAGIKDGGVSKEEQPRLEFYQKQLNELKNEFKQSQDEFNKMTNGNTLEYVKNNYSKLAGQVYFGDLTNQLATAYRTDVEKNLVTTNPAGMLKLRLETDRANMYIQDDMDRSMEGLKHQYGIEDIMLKGQLDKELAIFKNNLENPGQTGIPQNSTPDTENNVNIPQITKGEFINKNLVPAKNEATNSYEVLNAYVTKALGQDGKFLNNQQLVNYVTEQENKKNKNQPYNKDVINAYERYKSAKDNLEDVNNQIAAVDATIKSSNPELFDGRGLDNNKLNIDIAQVGSVKTKIPSLSEQDMYKILQGESVNGFTVGKRDSGGFSGGGTGGGGWSSGKVMALYYHGQLVNTDMSYGDYEKSVKKGSVPIGLLFHHAMKINIDNSKRISELETKMYSENSYINSDQTVFNPKDLETKKGTFKQQYDETFKSILHVDGGLNDKNGYTILGRTKDGTGVYVQLIDDENKVRSVKWKGTDLILDKLRESGLGVKITKDEKTNSYIIPDILPRYSNLPSNQTLAKFNEVKKSLNFIERALKENSKFKNAVIMDSKQLPSGGTKRYVGESGIEYLISIKKERGYPMKYVATYTIPSTHEQVEVDGNTTDQLFAKLQ